MRKLKLGAGFALALSIAWAHGGALSAARVDGAEPETGRSITLSECRAIALARNPGIVAAQSGLDAARGAYRQSRAFPNPELVVEAEDFGGDFSPWSQSQTTFAISQRLELPSKRAARMEAGRWGMVAAAEDLERARRDLLAGVERRFLLLLAAQARQSVWQENVLSGDTLLTVVSSLVQAGEVSPIEEDRARVDRSLMEIESRSAEAALRAALIDLAALMGDAAPRFAEARGSLENDRQLPALEQVLVAASEAPELRWWDAETTRRKAAARLDHRARLPDLTFQAGLRTIRATREESYVASVGLGLPLFDRSGGAAEEAFSRSRQAEAEKQSAGIALRAEILSAYEALSSALAGARIVSSSILVDSESVTRALDEGYRRGKFSLLDVLDSRRALADARLRSIDGWVAAELARVQMERLLGRSLFESGGEAR